MNTVAQPHDQLELYATGALDSRDMASFASHLDTCAECNAQLPTLMRTVAALIPDSPPPAHIWTRISEAIQAS